MMEVLVVCSVSPHANDRAANDALYTEQSKVGLSLASCCIDDTLVSSLLTIKISLIAISLVSNAFT